MTKTVLLIQVDTAGIKHRKVVVVLATDTHAASSSGQPVILIDGEPFGPGDIDGSLEVDDPILRGKLAAAGYECRPAIDEVG